VEAYAVCCVVAAKGVSDAGIAAELARTVLRSASGPDADRMPVAG
jgi:hypothetical protein